MTEYEDYFKCEDCKHEYRCPGTPDGRSCTGFTLKREVRLPIEGNLFVRILLTESGESITLSQKEIFILLDVLDKDIKNRRKKFKVSKTVQEINNDTISG